MWPSDAIFGPCDSAAAGRHRLPSDRVGPSCVIGCHTLPKEWPTRARSTPVFAMGCQTNRDVCWKFSGTSKFERHPAVEDCARAPLRYQDFLAICGKMYSNVVKEWYRGIAKRSECPVAGERT